MKESIQRSKTRCQVIIDTPIIEPKKKFSPHSSKSSLKHSISKEAIRSQGTIKNFINDMKAEEIKTDDIKNDEKNDSDESDDKNEYNSESLDIIESKPLNQEKPAQIVSNIVYNNDPIYIQEEYNEIEIIDFMPYIEELKQLMTDFKNEYSVQISSIYLNIQETHKELTSQISETKEKQQSFIETYTKKGFEMDILMREAIHECSMVSNLRKRDMSDINSSIFEVSTKLENFIENNTKFEDKLSEITQRINSLIEISKISMSLQEQDEKDRESISLMGYKEAKPSAKNSIKKPVITIDKMCQSCTGQGSIVLSAFKMACLAYTPSSVLFSSQVFSRKELIDMQKRIIEGILAPNALHSVSHVLEEKQKNRAKSAFSMRRYRPNSLVAGSNVTNIEIYSSIGSDLPVLQKKF